MLACAVYAQHFDRLDPAFATLDTVLEYASDGGLTQRTVAGSGRVERRNPRFGDNKIIRSRKKGV